MNIRHAIIIACGILLLLSGCKAQPVEPTQSLVSTVDSQPTTPANWASGYIAIKVPLGTIELDLNRQELNADLFDTVTRKMVETKLALGGRPDGFTGTRLFAESLDNILIAGFSVSKNAALLHAAVQRKNGVLAWTTPLLIPLGGSVKTVKSMVRIPQQPNLYGLLDAAGGIHLLQLSPETSSLERLTTVFVISSDDASEVADYLATGIPADEPNPKAFHLLALRESSDGNGHSCVFAYDNDGDGRIEECIYWSPSHSDWRSFESPR